MRHLPQISTHHADPNTYPEGVAFMDGQYLKMADAKISVLDYGFLHSDATYDVVHVWDGAFFRLDDHLTRFFRGLKKLHMTIPFERSEVAQILYNCVVLSGLRNSYVEFICTRGTSPSFSRDPRDAVNRFIAFAIPFGSVANSEQMRRGLHVAISDIVRIPPASVDSTIKNYHWLDLVTGLYDAYAQGAETVILKDATGSLAEGPGFNLFVVQGGKVATPDYGVLLGVTRRTVFDLCRKLQIDCDSRPISPQQLFDADEAFVTSTAGGVMPVTRVNDRSIATGEVGPLTEKIKEAYWRLHAAEEHRTIVEYPSPASGD